MRYFAKIKISAFLLFVVTVFGCAPPSLNEPDLSAAPRRDLNSKEKLLLTEAIKGSLKDPESAIIEWTKIPTAHGLSFSYCALVNGKNSLGGYVGEMPTLILVHTSETGEVDQGHVIGISTGQDTFGPDYWGLQCRNLGYTAAL